MDDDVTFEEVAPEDGDASAGKSPAEIIKALKQEIKACERERGEYLAGWQRAKADLVNFRKTEEKEREGVLAWAKLAALTDFFDLADTFELAFSHEAAWNKVEKEWRVGIESIYAKLLAIFERHGVTPFGEEGEKFDPARHQSIGSMRTDEEAKDDRVAEVVQRGYRMGEKIIRPARVKIWQKS